MFYDMSDEPIWRLLSWLSCVWDFGCVGIILKGSSLHVYSLWYHIEGELTPCLFLIIELHNKSFRLLFFYVCAYMLSSTTKKGEIESAIMPLIIFWCWWQHICSGLIMFIKYISGLCSKDRVHGSWLGTKAYNSRMEIQDVDFIYGLFLSIGIPHY